MKIHARCLCAIFLRAPSIPRPAAPNARKTRQPKMQASSVYPNVAIPLETGDDARVSPKPELTETDGFLPAKDNLRLYVREIRPN